MPTIVKHKSTGKHYILISANYSYFKDSRASVLGGVLFPHKEEGEFELSAVCNEDGIIEYIPTWELIVVQVDNSTPKEILKNFPDEILHVEESDTQCPACKAQVYSWDSICPSCGLTLISENAES